MGMRPAFFIVGKIRCNIVRKEFFYVYLFRDQAGGPKAADLCVQSSQIDPALYTQYDVKRGLRDLNGKGVLTGLTKISEIISSKTVNGQSVPCEGELYYRGYSVEEIIRCLPKGDNFGYERTAYLLLFGSLLPGNSFRNSVSCWRFTARCPQALCGISS